MPEWIIPPVPGLVELSTVPEILVHDIAAAELIGQNVRAYYSVDQLPLEVAGGGAQKIVQVKLIWPAYKLPMAMGRWGQAFAVMCGPEREPLPQGPFPRLVR